MVVTRGLFFWLRERFSRFWASSECGNLIQSIVIIDYRHCLAYPTIRRWGKQVKRDFNQRIEKTAKIKINQEEASVKKAANSSDRFIVFSRI